MAILDCESYSSSLGSICTLYGITRHDIITFLRKIDVEEEYKSKVIYDTCDDHIKNLFESRFGKPIKRIRKTRWFHLTRVPMNTDFSEGILPLHEVLGRIWDTMEAILVDPQEKNNISALKSSYVPDFQYNLKTHDHHHSGPYAMLVRDAAFNAKHINNHDYLGVPEIIEDICNGYREAYGCCIYSTIVAALKKCIVKFESSKCISEHLIAPALLYCWCKANAADFHPFANTCFDSGGKAIPKGRIIRVEFL